MKKFLLMTASGLAIATAGFSGAVLAADANVIGSPAGGSVPVKTSVLGQQAHGDISKYAAGTVLTPNSSMKLQADLGKRRHTHIRFVVPPAASSSPAAQRPASSPSTVGLPPSPGYFFETPGSIACIYGLVQGPAGCNPNTTTQHLTVNGSKAIGIVDAYDFPTALSDLTTFSAQFGLPAPTSANFQVVYASGTKPPDGSGSGWDLEASLDIEYAHAMAPNAKIYLVEAASNSNSDLDAAVLKASQLVAAAGGGQVSMSYGGGEYSGETSEDSTFTTAKVVYFASSGDSPGTEYPCVSPNVVCVGGTTIARNATSGKFQGEFAWTSTGGGISAYEPRPAYQAALATLLPKRGVPDVGAIADPNTGAWVYNSTYGSSPGWWFVGGTSLAAPVVAGIVNSAGHFIQTSVNEHNTIYSVLGVPNGGWTNMASGGCFFYNGATGVYTGEIATSYWNGCTGIGTPMGWANK